MPPCGDECVLVMGMMMMGFGPGQDSIHCRRYSLNDTAISARVNPTLHCLCTCSCMHKCILFSLCTVI